MQLLRSMKIAICVGTMEQGGAINSVTYIARGLEELGHECTVLVTQHNPGSYFSVAKKRFTRFYHVSEGAFWLKSRLKKTFDALRDFDFIINNHSKEVAMIGSLLCGKKNQISVIRGVSPVNFSDAIRNSHYLDALVAISPSVVEGLTNNSACPVHLIPNAVMVPERVLPKLENKVRISYLGRVVQEDKNVMVIPKVSCVLENLGIEHEIVIVGDGRDAKNLEDEADELGVRNNIQLLGFKEKDEAMNIISKTHFMICPSNYEGFGLYVAEAMAMGVLPIVSPLKVFTWILGDQHHNLQVTHNEGGEYANIIVSMLDNADKFTAVQMENKERWREHFTLDRLLADYNKLINEVKNQTQIKEPDSLVWKRPVELCGINNLRYSRLYMWGQTIKRALIG